MLGERLHHQWLRLKAVFKRRQLDHDLAEELEFHLAMREQKLIVQGMSPREAHYAARRGFGNVALLKETNRELWGFPSLESWLQDVRFGLRTLAKNRGFTAVAVLTLALGIGGTTAIFSVLYGGVLDPFPYHDSRHLVRLVSRDGGAHSQGYQGASLSGSEFLDYQDQNHVFDEVIGDTGLEVTLTGTDEPDIVNALEVTGNLFRVLGVPPLVGRALTPQDAKPGASRVAVLSYKAWQSNFGGDPRVIGRTIGLNHRPTTVVGVMPPRFGWGGDSGFWLPATVSKGKSTEQQQYFSLVGHLKSGVSIEQAKADVAVLASRFAEVYPKDHPKGVSFTVVSLAESATGDAFRTMVYILLAAVSLVLLIACVNVANLLLARAAVRERETAIRAALGAGRGRLVRQFLVESLLLAMGGAGLGCLLALNAVAGQTAIIPPGTLPSEAEIRINVPVLLFTLGVAVISTILFGLTPALLTVTRELQEPLKASGRGAGESHGRSRLRNLLVVGEVTLSLVLLTGGCLLIRSFFGLRQIKPGYDLNNIVETAVGVPEERYKTPEQRHQFNLEFLRRVRAVPGVVSASLNNPPPIFPGYPTFIEIQGKPSAENQQAHFWRVGVGFFETMRIGLLQGRGFSEQEAAQRGMVAVINRAFALRYFGYENALGRHVKMTSLEEPPFSIPRPWFEIIGVSADTAVTGAFDLPVIPAEPAVYVPYMVSGDSVTEAAVRTAGKLPGLESSLRRVASDMDREATTVSWSLAEQSTQLWYILPRFVLTMLVALASLGLVLASVGVYCVLSYSVSRRTQEIGIRMALGAEAADVRWSVVKAGLKWLTVGIGIGVPASIALAKVLQNRIWGIKSADPLTLVAVSAVLIVVGLAACYFPARRATKVDPMVALRCE